jgi:hypothetical protein
MFAQRNRTCCSPAPMICLHFLNVISGGNRFATAFRMSAIEAETSVQKNATDPVGSSNNTTRVTPPAGRHDARNVLYRLVTRSRCRVKASVVHPPRWPARWARVTRSTQ